MKLLTLSRYRDAVWVTRSDDRYASISKVLRYYHQNVFPEKALGLVRERLSIHKDALQEMWNTQEFKKLPPLE